MTRSAFGLGMAAAMISLPLAAVGPDVNLPAPIDPSEYRAVDPALASLGQLLFYDPILSGNRNISCGTCHHPNFGTGDGVSLSLGEGGVGLGPDRVASTDNRPEERIPRHAPALFNLGHADFTTLFHDGRIEVDPTRPSGLRTPMGTEMEAGFASLLSAQTMFPVLSPDEMAGHYSENEISRAVRMGLITGDDGAWDLLTDRLEVIPAYRAAFVQAFDLAPDDHIRFTQVSDAIAAFMELEWRADNSPFDRYLRGELPLDAAAMTGMTLFYGAAGCSACHSGAFQTDHDFHATGLVQFGPGKRARFQDHREDRGRFGVTGAPEDLYAFRTPSLRNVIETAPYGHTGAYAELRDFLQAHRTPRAAWDMYDPALTTTPVLEEDTFAPLADLAARDAILAQVPFPDQPLTEAELAALTAFLAALTDPQSITGRLGVPEDVPSGLPVDR